MFLGAGNPVKGTTVSHHNPLLSILMKTYLPTGVAMHVHGALNYLNTNRQIEKEVNRTAHIRHDKFNRPTARLDELQMKGVGP
jgi:uncharacterized membrane protein YidH (DUF202 family)